MRVISGIARHVPLVTPEGLATRPTTDRIKETLFNIIRDRVFGSSFLDLYAGSGGIGIEALSCGASSAVFVEREKRALECINLNLKKTHLENKATVLAMDCANALAQLERTKESFDIIFMDPPYKAGEEKKILDILAYSSLVSDDTLIIVEAALENDLETIIPQGLEITRVKAYKSNKHYFIMRGASTKF